MLLAHAHKIRGAILLGVSRPLTDKVVSVIDHVSRQTLRHRRLIADHESEAVMGIAGPGNGIGIKFGKQKR